MVGPYQGCRNYVAYFASSEKTVMQGELEQHCFLPTSSNNHRHFDTSTHSDERRCDASASSFLGLLAVTFLRNVAKNIYQTIRRHIPKDSILHGARRVNLKSHTQSTFQNIQYYEISKFIRFTEHYMYAPVSQFKYLSTTSISTELLEYNFVFDHSKRIITQSIF
jgi:hypothetical protein